MQRFGTRQWLGACNSAHLCTGSCNTCSGGRRPLQYAAHHNRSSCAVGKSVALYTYAIYYTTMLQSLSSARQYCGRREHCHANTGAPCARHAEAALLSDTSPFSFFQCYTHRAVVGSTACPRVSFFSGTCVLMVARYGTSKKTTFDAINLLQSMFYWSRAFT